MRDAGSAAPPNVLKRVRLCAAKCVRWRRRHCAHPGNPCAFHRGAVYGPDSSNRRESPTACGTSAQVHRSSSLANRVGAEAQLRAALLALRSLAGALLAVSRGAARSGARRCSREPRSSSGAAALAGAEAQLRAASFAGAEAQCGACRRSPRSCGSSGARRRLPRACRSSGSVVARASRGAARSGARRCSREPRRSSERDTASLAGADVKLPGLGTRST